MYKSCPIFLDPAIDAGALTIAIDHQNQMNPITQKLMRKKQLPTSKK